MQPPSSKQRTVTTNPKKNTTISRTDATNSAKQATIQATFDGIIEQMRTVK